VLSVEPCVKQGRGYSVTVTGLPTEVDAWRDRYFPAYHPAGYGTRERSRSVAADGTVTIVVWRSDSCD
jgi:hypothetical protein